MTTRTPLLEEGRALAPEAIGVTRADARGPLIAPPQVARFSAVDEGWRRTDAACYRAAQTGGGHVVVAEPSAG
jgi:hypothetical protein